MVLDFPDFSMMFRRWVLIGYTFTPEFKAKGAIETIKEIMTISELTRSYQIHPDLISLRKNEFLAKAGMVYNSGTTNTLIFEKNTVPTD